MQIETDPIENKSEMRLPPPFDLSYAHKLVGASPPLYRNGLSAFTGGAPNSTLIALPWSLLIGSTLTERWTGPDPDDAQLIVVPATRVPGTRGWVAKLLFEQRPASDVPLERVELRSRTVLDAPAGLDTVTLKIYFQRWRTVGDKKYFNSPVPDGLGMVQTGDGEGQKATARVSQTAALHAYLEDVDSRLDIPPDVVSRCVDGDQTRLNRLRRSQQDTPRARRRAVSTDRFVLYKPEDLPNVLAIDEVHLGKMYWTVLSDNDGLLLKAPGRLFGQRTIGICQGRTEEDLKPMLTEVATWYTEAHFDKGERRYPNPALVSADMWQPFRDAMVTAFGEDQFFSADMFHIVRRFERAWQAAEEACLNQLGEAAKTAVTTCQWNRCSCQHKDICRRYQRAKRLHEHARTLNSVKDTAGWKAFRRTWNALFVLHAPVPKGCEEDFNGLHPLMTSKVPRDWSSPARILAQTFAAREKGRSTSNARAERLNFHIWTVLKHMRIESPFNRLPALMEQLHLPPVCPEAQEAMLPPSLLRCPVCDGPAVHPDSPTFQRVWALPKGLIPLQIQVPTTVLCSKCVPQTVSLTIGKVLPECAVWLREPLNHVFPHTTLNRWIEISTSKIKALQGGAPYPPARQVKTEPVLYDEVWTVKRVWLLLSTSEGDLVDLRVISKAAVMTLEPKKSVPVRVQKRQVQAWVAKAAVDMLLAHEPPAGYRQVVLFKENAELTRALKQQRWKINEAIPDEQRSDMAPFTLAAFEAHELVKRFAKRALIHLSNINGQAENSAVNAEESTIRKTFYEMFNQEVTRCLDHPFWQFVNSEDPVQAQMQYVIEDAKVLQLLLCRHNEQAADQIETPDFQVESRDPRALLELLLAGDDLMGSDLREQQLRTWRALKPLLLSTILLPPVSAGKHPATQKKILQLLRNSPGRELEEQRVRVLAVIAAERELRATDLHRQTERRARKTLVRASRSLAKEIGPALGADKPE